MLSLSLLAPVQQFIQANPQIGCSVFLSISLAYSIFFFYCVYQIIQVVFLRYVSSIFNPPTFLILSLSILLLSIFNKSFCEAHDQNPSVKITISLYYIYEKMAQESQPYRTNFLLWSSARLMYVSNEIFLIFNTFS